MRCHPVNVPWFSLSIHFAETILLEFVWFDSIVGLVRLGDI